MESNQKINGSGQWDIIEMEGKEASLRGEVLEHCPYKDKEQIILWLNGWYWQERQKFL